MHLRFLVFLFPQLQFLAVNELPAFKEIDCNPCARPHNWSTLDMPPESPLCYKEGEPMAQWPSKKWCPLPNKIRSPEFDLKDGEMIAKKPLCLNETFSFGYSFWCDDSELPTGIEVFTLNHP